MAMPAAVSWPKSSIGSGVMHFMAVQQEDEPRPRASPDSERLPTTSGDDPTASWTVGELRQ